MIAIDRMRIRVRKPLGMEENDSDLTDDDIDEYLNMAFWEVQDKFPFREKERSGTFLTVAGTRNYEMPKPFECLRELAIVNPVSGQHSPLIQMTTTEYEEKYIDDTISDKSQAIPTHYVREQTFARLWPTPDKVYTIWMRRLIILQDLSDENTVQPLPQIWTEILIYGAIWRAFIDFGDFVRSQKVQQHQITLISSVTPTPVKELGDTSMAGVEVMGRTYDQEDEPEFRRQRPWNER